MLPIHRSRQAWHPAPRRLGQELPPIVGSDIPGHPRMALMTTPQRTDFGLLNYGTGLAVGAGLGGILLAFGAKPTKTTAFLTSGMGVILGLVGINWSGFMSQAQMASCAGGVLSGLGGTQLLKVYGK